jgi:hypothetical protein
MAWMRKSKKSSAQDEAVTYSLTGTYVAEEEHHGSSKQPSEKVAHPESEDRPWSHRLNPLKTRVIPPIPEERQPSREATASFISQALFSWITPLMHVSLFPRAQFDCSKS